MVRRSQAQRSSSTQKSLLNATIECLVELGYEGTSTPEICRRAGVSRGAQLHHFPTKVSLLVAAVEHLCDIRHQEFRLLIEKSATGAQRLDLAFEELWKVYTGPTLSAWMEMVVASRTDSVLNEHMRRISQRLEDETEVTLRDLFGISQHVPGKAAVRLVLSLLDGLAFRTILQDDGSAKEALTIFRHLVQPWLGQGKEQ